MSMATLLHFCRLNALIFVEETTKGPDVAYRFLDQGGKMLVYTSTEIFNALVP